MLLSLLNTVATVNEEYPPKNYLASRRLQKRSNRLLALFPKCSRINAVIYLYDPPRTCSKHITIALRLSPMITDTLYFHEARTGWRANSCKTAIVYIPNCVHCHTAPVRDKHYRSSAAYWFIGTTSNIVSLRSARKSTDTRGSHLDKGVRGFNFTLFVHSHHDLDFRQDITKKSMDCFSTCNSETVTHNLQFGIFVQKYALFPSIKW